MSVWKFNATTLRVLEKPEPGRSSGYKKIAFEVPGADGIASTIDDGRLPAYVSVSVSALTKTEAAALEALFANAGEGELQMPVGDDAWVYDEAFVQGKVDWVKRKGGEWVARVTFACKNPVPTWLSSGLDVY